MIPCKLGVDVLTMGHQVIAACHLPSIKSPGTLSTAALVGYRTKIAQFGRDTTILGCAVGCFSLPVS